MQRYFLYLNKNGEMFVWAHPFDLHFKVNELSGWPKLILKIWRFN